MKKVCIWLTAIVLITSAALARAQETAAPLPPPAGAAGGMAFFQAPDGPTGKVLTSSYNYVYTTNIGEREAVKGAPYSATAVTESTQVLTDGNRIVNKSSSFQARDSEGRTRRDMPKGLGPLPADLPEMVMISDPVSQTDYMLNLKEKTADVMKRLGDKEVFFEQIGKDHKERHDLEQKMKFKTKVEQGQTFHVEGAGEVRQVEFGGEVKHEDLGTQVIEGVPCSGRRETKTIPAGAIGNERPLDIISESWTSADLHTTVLSKHTDPRFGETVYRLTDIQRNEPDPSLFQVPSDYRILHASDLPATRIIHSSELPSPKE